MKVVRKEHGVAAVEAIAASPRFFNQQPSKPFAQTMEEVSNVLHSDTTKPVKAANINLVMANKFAISC